MAVVDLRSQPIVQTPYGRWQPLNGALGIDAVGVNAGVIEPGEELDRAHDESESGHQEIYVVVAGRLAFTLGDEEIIAEPGQVIAAPDPSVTRGYRALEPETRVVCFGVAPVADPHPFGAWIEEAEEG